MLDWGLDLAGTVATLGERLKSRVGFVERDKSVLNCAVTTSYLTSEGAWQIRVQSGHDEALATRLEGELTRLASIARCQLIVDLTGTQKAVGTATLSVLAKAADTAADNDGALRIVCPPASVTISITDADPIPSVLERCPTMQDALDGVRAARRGQPPGWPDRLRRRMPT